MVAWSFYICLFVEPLETEPSLWCVHVCECFSSYWTTDHYECCVGRGDVSISHFFLKPPRGLGFILMQNGGIAEISKIQEM